MKDKKMFYDGLVVDTEQGTLLRASRCCKCGQVQFPIKNLCTACLSEEQEEIAIGKYGKIFSVTTTYGPVSKLTPPVTVAYLELPEGIRVFAPLKKEEGVQYEIGMDMELEIADLWEEDDTIVTGYTYKRRAVE